MIRSSYQSITMCKRLLFQRLLCLALLSPALPRFVQAQVTLALQVPPTGVMQKNQLWNMVLINTGNAGSAVIINLTLVSVRDNQPVMTAVSRPVILTKGSNTINANVASPVQYSYLSPVFNADRDPNGFLPIGNYKACYTVQPQLSHAGYALAEDCLPVEVQPLSPLQLNLPGDTSVLQTAYPQFNWLPPMPVNLFSNLNYTMLLVEVLPGQGAYEAIQENIPVYNISHYKDVVHLYPASGKALDTGRIYAWRVIAMNEDEPVSQSEVWTFKLAKTKPPTVLKPDNGNYIELRKNNDPTAGIGVVTGNVIGLKYYSYEKEQVLLIRFLSGDGKLLQTVIATIGYGDNYLAYPTGNTFQKGKLYRVEITDGRKNNYIARFSVH